MNSNHTTPDRTVRFINGYSATGILGAAASHSLSVSYPTGGEENAASEEQT